MIVISAKKVYNVDTISHYNDNGWILIDKAVDECKKNNPNEEVVVDFKGINLVEPWLNAKFREFMAKKTANLVLYNSEDVADYIKTMCITGGMGNNRVKDITIHVEKGKTREELAIERVANNWQDIIVPSETAADVAIINIRKMIDQISSAKTIRYIEKAIEIYHNNHPNVIKYVLNTESMSVEAHSIEAIGKLIVTLQQRDKIYLRLQNNDPAVENDSRMFAAIKSQGEYDNDKRLESIEKYLKSGRPGLLMAYARSRSVDRMGRSGNGEIRSCQPAIYLGLRNTSEGPAMRFKVYQLDKFCTRVHWALEHDGESHKIVSREVVIPVSNCGLYGIYLGKEYHFNEPLQYHSGIDNGSVKMYEVNEKGNSVRVEMTIPEFIKRVLDDYNEEYDKEYLDRCIMRTKAIIEHNDNKKDNNK